MQLPLPRALGYLFVAHTLACTPAPPAIRPPAEVPPIPEPIPVPAPVATPDAPMIDLRLFGKVSVSAEPQNIFDPMLVTQAPKFEPGEFALNSQETFNGWVNGLEKGTLQYGVSIFEAAEHLPPLSGLSVADVGAGYGNNLLAWKENLGPQGRVLFTEIDPNAGRFMAYSAHKNGYGERAMVVQNLFDDPCLPVGEFDLVVLSQLHYHVTIGPYPKTVATVAEFREKSAIFLGAARRALRDEKSLLIVIEGYQDTSAADPQRNFLPEAEAIENIKANGFTLVKNTSNDHAWVASFTRSD